MIVVRTVFQVKWGHADEVVQAFKAMVEGMGGAQPGGPQRGRLLTDLSGRFFTVVLESEVESLAAWEAFRQQMFARPDWGESFARASEWIESGQQEFYTIEAEVGSSA